jgi:hypothetical protein
MIGYLRVIEEGRRKYWVLSVREIDFNLMFLVPSSTVGIKSIISYNNGVLITNTEYENILIEEECTDFIDILEELGVDKHLLDDVKEIKLWKAKD